MNKEIIMMILNKFKEGFTTYTSFGEPEQIYKTISIQKNIKIIFYYLNK